MYFFSVHNFYNFIAENVYQLFDIFGSEFLGGWMTALVNVCSFYESCLLTFFNFLQTMSTSFAFVLPLGMDFLIRISLLLINTLTFVLFSVIIYYSIVTIFFFTKKKQYSDINFHVRMYTMCHV